MPRSGCAGCGEWFGGVRLFDDHRIGPHNGDRRCLTLQEMVDKGWKIDEKMVWHSPLNAREQAGLDKAAGRQRSNGSSTRRVGPARLERE